MLFPCLLLGSGKPILAYSSRVMARSSGGSDWPAGFLRIAGEQGGGFDDGVGKLPHGAHKSGNELGIELRIGAAFKFAERFLGGPTLFVAAVAGDRVVGVRNRNDAGAEWNASAGQSVGITGTVKEFVMMQDHMPDASHRYERFKQLSAVRHMG